MEKHITINNGETTLSCVLHTPQTEQDLRCVILFFNRMEEHKTGPHRMFIEMAREWTKLGFTCFRFDPAGQGESSQSQDRSFLQYLSDSRAVREFVENEVQPEKIILLGMCRGAKAAVHLNIIAEHLHDMILISLPYDVPYFYHRRLDFLIHSGEKMQREGKRKKKIELIFWKTVFYLQYLIFLMKSKWLALPIVKGKSKQKKGAILLIYGSDDKDVLNKSSYYKAIFKSLNIPFESSIIEGADEIFSSFFHKCRLNQIILRWFSTHGYYNPHHSQCLESKAPEGVAKRMNIRECEIDQQTLYYQRFSGPEQQFKIILCPPILDEYFKSYSIVVKVAKKLSLEGYDVILFDYEGTGESGGTASQLTMERMIASVEKMINIYPGEEENMALMGIRCGALIAALYQQKNQKIKRLIFWEPLLDTKNYVNKLFMKKRLRALKRKKRVMNCEEIPAGYEDLMGHLVRKDFLHSLEKFSFLESLNYVKCDVLAVSFANNSSIINIEQSGLNKIFSKFKTAITEEEVFWNRWDEEGSKYPAQILEKTIQWLNRSFDKQIASDALQSECSSTQSRNEI